MLAKESLLEEAGRELEEFRAIVRNVPYESKGILFSEMYFFWLIARQLSPRRILESGRARGQSTLILSLCFPRSEIISVEFDRDSPDVSIAASRLKDRDNVRLLFGDATRILPDIIQPGDIALIDGPKGYRGLRLAIKLLARGIQGVFVHDTSNGSSERQFLERRIPEAFYSDQTEFAFLTHSLDADLQDSLAPERRWCEPEGPTLGYGFSLCCIPQIAERSYARTLYFAVLDGFVERHLRRK